MLGQAIRPQLNRLFKPAFLGRTLLVPYYPLSDDMLTDIVRLKLGKIERRLKENHRIQLKYDDDLVDLVRQRCTEVESGARNIDHLLGNTLLPEISRNILAGMAAGEILTSVSVGVSADGELTYDWERLSEARIPALSYAG